MDLEAARPYIEAALEHALGSHTFDDVKGEVAAGRMQFWPGVHSAIVTEILEYPQHKVLHFFLAGGNLAELEAMYPLVEEWGQEQGCTIARLIGRKGWERTALTQRKGWSHRLAVFEKALSDVDRRR